MNNKTKVVFISGMFAGGWIWDRMLIHFPSEHYEVEIIDEPLGEIGHSVEQLSTMIYKKYVMNQSNRVILIGNSLGGLLALKIAVTYQKDVLGIVLSGSPGMQSTNLGIGLPRTNKKWLQQLVEKLFVHENVTTDSELNTIVDFFQDRKNVKNVIRLTRETNRYPIVNDLKQLQCPTYLMWGENDQITPIEPWERHLHMINDGYLHIFNQCGHSPMIEKPYEFSTQLQMFIHKLQEVENDA